MELHHFTEGELNVAKRIVFAEYIQDLKPYQFERPTGILLGGQPAAGKTGLITYLRRQRQGLKFIVINGDEYRQYHPRARAITDIYGQSAPHYTQPFSNALVEYIKAECLRLGCNFIIEGTMRNYAVIEWTAQEVKQANFSCEADVLAVAREDSLLGVFQRFEADMQRTGIGRFSPINIHDEAYQNIPLNVAKANQQRLFDRIVVYNRNQNGQLVMGIDRARDNEEPVDIVAEFERLRTPIAEHALYQKQWLAIKGLAEQRGETNEQYLKQINDFIQSFSQS